MLPWDITLTQKLAEGSTTQTKYKKLREKSGSTWVTRNEPLRMLKTSQERHMRDDSFESAFDE